jgi:hypothetical protein
MIAIDHKTNEQGTIAGVRWMNSAVRICSGNAADIHELLPTFERRRLGDLSKEASRVRPNEHLDAIYRLPHGDDPYSVPVGVVSTRYALLQHREVAQTAASALAKVGISPSATPAELLLTQYGERMRLRFRLPGSYEFDPGDGHPISLQVELLNSVEGSTRFSANMFWHRLVCDNGLIINVAHEKTRRHVGEVKLQHLPDFLDFGLQESAKDAQRLSAWQGFRLFQSRIADWADSVLRNQWGFKAAARVYHIALTGHDAEIDGAYKGHRPTTVPVRLGGGVPGAPRNAANVYDLAQTLAWIAKGRGELKEQVEWRDQIPALLEPMLITGE